MTSKLARRLAVAIMAAVDSKEYNLGVICGAGLKEEDVLAEILDKELEGMLLNTEIVEET